MAGYARLLSESQLQQLEQDEDYQALDPAGQRKARASLLQFLANNDQNYIADPESEGIYQETFKRAPIINGVPFKGGTYDPSIGKTTGPATSGGQIDPQQYAKVNPYDLARSLIGGINNEATRKEALADAKRYLYFSKNAQGSFVEQLKYLTYDKIADIFGDDTPYFKNLYGKEAKVSAGLVEDALRRYDPLGADEAIASGAQVAGLTQFAESVPIAQASAATGIGVAAAKGMGTFLAKRGASAAMISLLGNAAREVGEGVGFGVYQVAADLAKERLGTGESLGAKWDERLGKIAKSFGTGMAIDAGTGLVMSLGKGAWMLAKGVYHKQPTGLEKVVSAITDAETLDDARKYLRDAMMMEDVSPGLYQAIPEGEYKRGIAATTAIAKVFDRVKDIDPTSIEGATAVALATGFHLEEKGKRILMTSLLEPSVTKDFSSVHGALKWAGNLWAESNPAPQQAINTAQGAARAAVEESTLSVETRGYFRPEDLGEGEAAKLLVPTSAGAIDTRNVAAYARWWLKGSGASEADIAAFKVLQGAQEEALETGVVVPKIIGTADGEVAYLKNVKDSLEAYGAKLGLTSPDVTKSESLLKLIAKPELDGLRPRTLQYVAKEFLDADLVIGKGEVRLSFQDGTVLRYADMKAANGAIFKNLITSGSLELPEVKKLMKETYGYDLVENSIKVGGVPYAQWEVVAATSPNAKPHLVAKGFTLAELFETRPDLVPKLPNRYAPELLFVDDSLTTLQTSRKAAMGSSAIIKDLIRDFRSGWVPGKKVSSSAGGSLYLSATGKQVFVLESPFGSRQKFIDSKQAVKALDKGVLNWENLVAEAAFRQMRVFPLETKSGGGFLLTEGNGVSFRARTLDEAAGWLQKQARPVDYPDLLGIPDTQIDTIEDGLLETIRQNGGYKVLGADDTWYEDGIFYKRTKKGVKATPKGDFLVPLVGEAIFPPETTFAQYAKLTHDDTILSGYRLIEQARNITDISIRKGQELIRVALSDGRGRLLNGKDLNFVSELLALPETEWASFAKVTQRNLSTSVYRSAKLAREIYDILGKRFNVDSSRWLREYVPKLQEVMQGGKFTPTLKGLKEASKALFGNIPKEIEFFSMNFRSGLVLDALMGERNAYNLLMAYNVQGNKSLYIGPVWEKLWDATEKLKAAGKNGLIPPGLQNRWEAYLSDVIGVQPSGLDRLHTQLSWALTTKISQIEEALLKGASKIPVAGRIAQDALEAGVQKRVLTSDILGRLSGRMTLNTQGLRPFVALRNTMDINRAGAVLGNSLVFDSLKEVLDDDAYVGSLMREGVIEDTLFTITAGEDIARNRTKELMSRGLIGSDIITRAATAKAVDKAFDTGLQRLGEGKWTWEQFFKRTGMYILPDDIKVGIADGVTKGNIAGARFLARKSMVDSTMFTFRSGTGNLLTRHVTGKMFGKFQNYSFGMIELYRKILSSGNFGDKALMLGKLTANALAVYYASKAIGIDYDGFLPSDSIGVSGGPYWRAAYAVLDAGKEGYAGRRAKQELLRTFLITAYPEPVVRSLTEGLELASQGRDRDAFLRLVLGAPVKKDF